MCREIEVTAGDPKYDEMATDLRKLLQGALSEKPSENLGTSVRVYFGPAGALTAAMIADFTDYHPNAANAFFNGSLRISSWNEYGVDGPGYYPTKAYAPGYWGTVEIVTD